MEERLQKILAQAGVASRRNAEKLITDGRVAVDGTAVTELGTKVDAAAVRITVDGKPIHAPERLVYFLLNKPKGYVTTVSDERGRRTVLDLLPEVKERIYPVGRLDNNTEGLLLLTNDGALTNGLLHPKQEVDKTYIARVQPAPTQDARIRLTEGVQLEDGLTAPALVRVLDSDGAEAHVEITIHEGRNRQVRRMFEAVGCDVKALKRTTFAGLTLAGVRRGAHRPLTQAELVHLRVLTGITEPRSAQSKERFTQRANQQPEQRSNPREKKPRRPQAKRRRK